MTLPVWLATQIAVAAAWAGPRWAAAWLRAEPEHGGSGWTPALAIVAIVAVVGIVVVLPISIPALVAVTAIASETVARLWATVLSVLGVVLGPLGRLVGR